RRGAARDRARGGVLGGRPGNHGSCGERSGGARRQRRCQMAARSSLLRRPTPGARPARRTSSVVAALAALATRLVRLAHHDYPDGLLMAIEAGGAPLAERLRPLLARRARGEEAAELATFARLLFARGGAYAEELAPEEAAVLVASAFRFLSAPGPELRVRALTPDYASEGWDAPVSIIETVMPDRAFIVDTIRLRLERAGVPLMALLHPIFAARRDPSGRLELLADPEGGTPRESFTHIAIPRSTDTAALARLEADIRDALEDVRLVTDDFAAMVARAQAVAAELDGLGRSRSAQLATEATAVADFLRWLVDGAFVFLGYREYGLTTLGAATMLQLRAGSGL